MRFVIPAAAMLGLMVGTATAGPLPTFDPGLAGPAAIETVHHKPGHHGGPPWTRGGNRGYDRDRDDGRYAVERRQRVTRCVTRYRESYDPYRGAYVRRPVEVCSQDYGYR
jgi:hypothetical protein